MTLFHYLVCTEGTFQARGKPIPFVNKASL